MSNDRVTVNPKGCETIIVTVSGWRDQPNRREFGLLATNVSIDMMVEYWEDQVHVMDKKFVCEFESIHHDEDPQYVMDEIKRQMAEATQVYIYLGAQTGTMEILPDAIVYQNFEPGKRIRTLVINDPQGIFKWMCNNQRRQRDFQLFLEQSK